MKNPNRIPIERLKKVMSINLKNKFTLVTCDNPDFNTSRIEVDHILILPDNDRRNLGQKIPKGTYSTSFS